MRLSPIVRGTLCACLLTILPAFASLRVSAQGQGAPPAKSETIPDDERKALDALNTATDPAGKVQVGVAFLKKYSKSPRRIKVANYLASEIAKVDDAAQRLTLAATYQSSFNQPEELDLVKPTVVDAYLKQNKFDEAFAEGAKHIARQPEDVLLQTQLGITGIEQAQRQNPKFLQVSQQYAGKAIELMEADKKPALIEAAQWQAYRNQWLPRLYQAQGVALYLNNDRPGARGKFEKSVGLDAQNPSTLMMLGMLADDEYQALAKQFNGEKSQAGKDAILKQAFAKMDEVIDWFARAVAASDGKAEFQQMNQSLMGNLEQYYKFRNNGSSDGMQKVIDKYKKPAGQ